MSDYDSRPDTYEHITRVRELMVRAINCLLCRAHEHDASKLVEPELATFDEFTPKLATLEYGTEEYKESLHQMGPALQHHFRHNSHHPEHFSDGIQGMSLLDLLEMLCDWRAASERTKQRMDGDTYSSQTFEDSLGYNQIRFNYSDELRQILFNTAKELDFF